MTRLVYLVLTRTLVVKGRYKISVKSICNSVVSFVFILDNYIGISSFIDLYVLDIASITMLRILILFLTVGLVKSLCEKTDIDCSGETPVEISMEGFKGGWRLDDYDYIQMITRNLIFCATIARMGGFVGIIFFRSGDIERATLRSCGYRDHLTNWDTVSGLIFRAADMYNGGSYKRP